MLDKESRESFALFGSKGAEILESIGREDLIRNKRATGRTQDLADAEFLERLQR